MIEKEAVKKIVDHALNPYKKNFVDNHIMHPEREWFIGIFVSLVIMITGSIFIYYFYNLYSNVSLEDGTEVVDPVVYRASLVQSALDEFAVREKIYNDLKPSSDQVNEPVTTTSLEAVPTENSTSTEAQNEEVTKMPVEAIPSEQPPPANQGTPTLGD